MKHRPPTLATSALLAAHPTARRMRGYRIRIWRGPQHSQSSCITPTMWRESIPLEEWQRVTSDPATISAQMIRSGRKLAAYRFERSLTAETEPQRAWTSADDERTAFNYYELGIGVIA